MKRNNKATTHIFILWANLPTEEATWEDYCHVIKQFPWFDPWGQRSTEGENNVVDQKPKGNDEEERIVATGQ